MIKSHIVSLPMSEVSVSRAREVPEGVKKIPRGCVTGCFTLPFRFMYRARYALALLFVSSISGHEVRPEASQTPFVRATAIAPVTSGASAPPDSKGNSFVQLFMDPSVKEMVRSMSEHAGNFNQAWKAKGLPTIPVSLQSCVAIESELTEEEKSELEISLGSLVEEVRVYDVSLQSGDAKRVFVLPDGSVLFSQIAYK
jgi:hypothetical protein